METRYELGPFVNPIRKECLRVLFAAEERARCKLPVTVEGIARDMGIVEPLVQVQVDYLVSVGRMKVLGEDAR